MRVNAPLIQTFDPLPCPHVDPLFGWNFTDTCFADPAQCNPVTGCPPFNVLRRLEAGFTYNTECIPGIPPQHPRARVYKWDLCFGPNRGTFIVEGHFKAGGRGNGDFGLRGACAMQIRFSPFDGQHQVSDIANLVGPAACDFNESDFALSMDVVNDRSVPYSAIALVIVDVGYSYNFQGPQVCRKDSHIELIRVEYVRQ